MTTVRQPPLIDLPLDFNAREFHGRVSDASNFGAVRIRLTEPVFDQREILFSRALEKGDRIFDTSGNGYGIYRVFREGTKITGRATLTSNGFLRIVSIQHIEIQPTGLERLVEKAGRIVRACRASLGLGNN